MYVFQQQIVTDWTLKQSSVVIILIIAFAVFGLIIWKVILPRFDKQQEKYEAAMKEQLDKSEKRADTSLSIFTVALERRDRVAEDTANAMRTVNESLRHLADKIDRN